MQPTGTEEFYVIAVTTNRNSFGLRGHMVVNKRGHVYEIGLNHLRERKVESVIKVPVDDEGQPQWHMIGAEIPTRKPDMPRGILNCFLSSRKL